MRYVRRCKGIEINITYVKHIYLLMQWNPLYIHELYINFYVFFYVIVFIVLRISLFLCSWKWFKMRRKLNNQKHKIKKNINWIMLNELLCFRLQKTLRTIQLSFVSRESLKILFLQNLRLLPLKDFQRESSLPTHFRVQPHLELNFHFQH